MIDHPSNRCTGGHVPVDGRPDLCLEFMQRKAQEAEAAEKLAGAFMTRAEAKADAEAAMRAAQEPVTERLYADEEGIVRLPDPVQEEIEAAARLLTEVESGSGPFGGHYGGADNPHEAVKCLEAWGLTSNAYLWTVAKYIARCGKKGSGADALADLRKANYYLSREILRREQGDTAQGMP